MSRLQFRTVVTFALLQATSLLLLVAEAFSPTPISSSLQERADRISSCASGYTAQTLCATLIPQEQSITTASDAIQSSVVWPASSREAATQWSQFAPKFWQNERGIDLRLTWNPLSTSSNHAADDMLQQAEQQIGKPLIQRDQLEQDLSSWMDTFADYCRNSLHPSSWEQLTARIVSSRGSISTKCPRWHLDHVPFRWIQSLQGPGCLWVDASCGDSSSASEILNHFLRESESDATYDDSTAEINQRRIDSSSLRIQSASPGEPVLLVGKSWNQSALDPKDLSPVIHKSPNGIRPWEGRILLTMDVEEPMREGSEND